MTGYERLNVLHGVFHPEGEPFRFDFSWLAPSGLSTKDFIAPSSFQFGEGRYFRMGRKIGAVSFLEILAPELNDRMLADILDLKRALSSICISAVSTRPKLSRLSSGKSLTLTR